MQIGPFELTGVLGRGGMGVVYRGEMIETGLEVAVKVIDEAAVAGPQSETLFVRELEAMAAVHHPGIARVIDSGRLTAAEGEVVLLPTGSRWLAMDLVEGLPLDEALAGRDWRALREVILQVLDALAHAHARGFLHRDVKPDNILVSNADGGRLRATLVDFGIALPLGRLRDGEEPVADESATVGTPNYLAPEQARGSWREQGPWTDLYALGCVIWELVSGAPPFSGSAIEVMVAHLGQAPPPLEARIALPDGFESWLGGLMEKPTHARFRRAADAAWALLQLGDAAGGVIAVDDERDFAPTLRVLPVDAPTSPELKVPSPAVGAPPIPAVWDDGGADRARLLASTGLALFGFRRPPLVGRWPQRQALWSVLLAAAGEKRPHGAVIHGEPGLGKSRLARWFVERAHELGSATVLKVSSSRPAGPLDGLVPALARHFNTVGADVDVASKQVANWADSLNLSRDERARLVAALPQMIATQYGSLRDSAHFWAPRERDEFVAAVVALLARERPVILWLADAQHARSVAEFAHHLFASERCRQSPLVVLVTLQDNDVVSPAYERVMALTERPDSVDVPLGLLDGDAELELVHALLGVEGSIARDVIARSSGNPLFAVQIIRDLVERRVLVPGSEGYVLAPGASIDIPDSTHEIWLGRIDRAIRRMPEHVRVQARDLVELLAIAGMRIAEAEAAALGSSTPAKVAYDALLESGLLRATPGGVHFSHTLLRDSIHRRAEEDRRAAGHHRVCADMLRDCYPERPPAVARRLAEHSFAAGMFREAIEPLRAAIQAQVDGSIDDAEELVVMLERIVDHLQLGPDDPNRVAALRHRATIHLLRGQPEPFFARLVEAQDMADRHELGAEQGLVRLSRANGLAHVGRAHEAVELQREALDYLRGCGERLGTAHAFQALGVAQRRANDVSGAIESGNWAVAIYQSLGERRFSISARSELACSLLGHERFDEARELLDDARETARELGARAYEAKAWMLQGLLEMLDRRWPDARRAFRLAREIDEPEGLFAAVVEVHEALVAACSGDPSAARPVLERCLVLFEETGVIFQVPSTVVGLALCSALDDDWAGFARFMARADTLLSNNPASMLLVAIASEQAALKALAAHELDHARTATAMAVEQWTRVGSDRRAERLRGLAAGG